MNFVRTLGAAFVLSQFLGTAIAAEASIERGEYVARLGNCVACHSVPDAPPFSGGLKMALPFGLGAIYGTNITPDKEHGIGNYTYEDFDRAMRLGVRKDGSNLYPAMPYPSYAKMSEEDMRALYDFFMKSVPASNVPNKPTEIPSPFNMRWPMAVWNFVFADDERYKPVEGKDAAWNRGAYLVQGLGHCGACHTPRGLAFNEKGYDETDSQFLVGAELDNWSASNLRGDVNTGLGRWTKEDLNAFLKTGKNKFGTAFGTMTEVINNSTQYMTDADIDAISTYLLSIEGGREGKSNPYQYSPATAEALKARKYDAQGALVYAQQCVTCHRMDGAGFAPYLPPIAGNPITVDPSPISLINLVLNGTERIVVDGMPDAYRMPIYRILLSDQEIADVVTFIRNSWGNKASAVTAAQVAEIRKMTDPASDQVHILRMK
jgi:mono/diheme cytochrome c family protein